MKIRKYSLLILAVLGVVLLAGCGRSDITLTVNGDGSFHAAMNYGIAKALVADEEVLGEVKALITDSLNDNNISYTESEDEDYVTITVERDFADLEELTSADAWRGISFVPSFTSDNDGSGIWTRYEEEKLKFSGTLNSETFNAKSIIGDMEDASGFSGSLRIILPEAAEAFSGGQIEDDSYVWSGTGNDSLAMDLVTPPIFGDRGGQPDETADDGDAASAVRKTTARDGLVTGLVVLVILAIAAVVVIAAKKRNK